MSISNQSNFDSTASATEAQSHSVWGKRSRKHQDEAGTLSCYAICPKGLEDLLAAEITGVGAEVVGQSVGAVYFSASHRNLYALCLWSRIANRVFLLMLEAGDSLPIENDVALYSAVREIPWELHFSENDCFSVDFVGTNKAINNTQYGAVRTKDAIVDRFRGISGSRPNVDKAAPDVRIQVRLHKGRVQVGLDMSGASLHQRGYRTAQGQAPLKENVAAAVLMRCGWPQASASGGLTLVDPMCGSGTLLVEGVSMALDIAPGLDRERFGFQGWSQFQAEAWSDLRSEALARRRRGVDTAERVRAIGFDEDPRMVAMANRNIAEAGLSEWVTVEQRRVEDFCLPDAHSCPDGLVVCNPPYGERLGEVEGLRPVYFSLAVAVKQHCPGWRLGVLTANRELAREMRMRPRKVNKLYNGALACELLLFDVLKPSEATLREDTHRIAESDLSEGSRMVLNRLRKNLRKLKPWLNKEGVDAYRIYDADMPEYAAAVDVYDGHLHVQEYAAPKDLPADVAARRLRELVSACATAFECSRRDISVKTRQRNSGKKQYEKVADRRQFITVTEGSAKFRVNLWDYLDTGLFLDHRPLRLRIHSEAKGKRFLNLFCYTASASVHAALGSAASTLSVDMSRTYLDWADENFALNHLNRQRNTLVQSDCIKWLANCREGFDLILLDPPTFSNSKRMEDVLDVQRDHVSLIRRCMDILNPGGTLYFSTNLRSFKLDGEGLQKYQVDDISEQTIDVDFARNPRIHRCYQIRSSEVIK